MSVLQRTEQVAGPVDIGVRKVGSSELPEAVLDALRARGVRVAPPETDGAPAGSVAFAAPAAHSSADAAAGLQGRRILVLHSNPEHASLLTWALAARGADARSLEDSPGSLDKAASFDADVILVDEVDLFAGSWERVCAVWQHVRMRWSTCLLSPSNLLHDGSAAELDGLCEAVRELGLEFQRCTDQAAQAGAFELRLGSLGPARTLRALLQSGASLQLKFVTGRLTVDVHIRDQLILGATTRSADGAGPEMIGVHALGGLLALTDATVRVGPACRNPLSNIMASLDSALCCGLDLANATGRAGASISGVHPVAAQVDEAEEDTRILSEGSMLALIKEERVVVLPSVQGAQQDGFPPQTADHEVQEPGRARCNSGGGVSFIARALFMLAATGLVALCGTVLWWELQPLGDSASHSIKHPTAASAHVSRVAWVSQVAQREPLAAQATNVPVQRPVEAESVVEKPSTVARDPAVARLVKRANQLRRQKRLSRARASYARALELAPDEPSALAGLARTAIAQDDLPTAMTCARRLVELAPHTDSFKVLLRRVEMLSAPVNSNGSSR